MKIDFQHHRIHFFCCPTNPNKNIPKRIFEVKEMTYYSAVKIIERQKFTVHMLEEMNT